MQSIKFTKNILIGFSKGVGYGNGDGPYYFLNPYNEGDVINCVIRPRVGMPEYNIKKEQANGAVDLLFVEEDLAAFNVDRNCFMPYEEPEIKEKTVKTSGDGWSLPKNYELRQFKRNIARASGLQQSPRGPLC